MSHAISPRPRSVGVVKRHFSIVASQFNQAYVQGLVDHFTAELRNLAPAATLTLHQVPGAFEVPVVVRDLQPGETPERMDDFWDCCPVKPNVREFAQPLIEGMVVHLEEIDERIKSTPRTTISTASPLSIETYCGSPFTRCSIAMTSRP